MCSSPGSWRTDDEEGPLKLPFAWEHAFGALGFGLLLVGSYLGLFVAPPEQMMGDVARILYVHVPAAWISLVCFTVSFVAALGYAFSGKRGWDHLTEASVEVGVVLCGLLIVLGAIFARPTWGVYWSWDPRLTASAIMLLTFVGVVVLRQLVEDPDRRALWCTVATILAYVNIPVTYMSVRWWGSLHQTQSEPGTMSDMYVIILRMCAFAFLFIAIWFMARRWRIAALRAAAEAPPPLPAAEVQT